MLIKRKISLMNPTSFSLYLALVCLHFFMGRFTPTTPETKFYFISPSMKSNLNRNFFHGGKNFYFGSHDY